jgi:lysophospholipase L1-like esterase
MATRARLGIVALLVALVVAVPVTPAAAKKPVVPTAAVSLGDSYISGEGGRWQGNSIDSLADRDGTDRAFTGTGYDLSRVYLPPSDTDGCHRSDVAEIRSGPLPVDERINIACSGAVTRNIFRTSSGGQGQNGELPEADQLATVARQAKVKLVVLSIGGNDLGFSSIVSACLQAYETLGPPCQPSQQAAIDANFPTAMANVGKAVDEVRAAMKSARYQPSSYRFVLQSYPSAIPRGSEIRVPEIDRNARTNIDGCPVYDSDATWARDSVVAQISNGLKAVAASRGVQFLDLRDFLQSHEMCSVATQLADPTNPPSATTSDWARFLNLSAVETQGQLQETFHPNAYAQQALGNCLGLIYTQTTNAACHSTPGGGTNAVFLTPTS